MNDVMIHKIEGIHAVTYLKVEPFYSIQLNNK